MHAVHEEQDRVTGLCTRYFRLQNVFGYSCLSRSAFAGTAPTLRNFMPMVGLLQKLFDHGIVGHGRKHFFVDGDNFVIEISRLFRNDP